ncbi:MAG: hypothetical protein ACFB0C_06320 [Leptolyngbyaceae cyanobacterium]
MTSTNNANEQADAKATGTSSNGTTARKTSRRQSKSQIVKAEQEKGDVFVLDDHTRIVPIDSLPNHRPIALSEFQVVGTLNSAGSRPIMADTLQVFSTDLLPGHRPVAVNTLPISDLDFLPNQRPIAPNDVVDPPAAVLMGYLD